eukprot:scaffold4588_cov112-Isochrysis_galbana.AAC.8
MTPAPWQHRPPDSDDAPAEIEVDAVIEREPPAFVPPITEDDDDEADLAIPSAEPWAPARLTRIGRGVRTSHYEPTMVASSFLSSPGGPFILYLCSGPPRRSGDFLLSRSRP